MGVEWHTLGVVLKTPWITKESTEIISILEQTIKSQIEQWLQNDKINNQWDNTETEKSIIIPWLKNPDTCNEYLKAVMDHKNLLIYFTEMVNYISTEIDKDLFKNYLDVSKDKIHCWSDSEFSKIIWIAMRRWLLDESDWEFITSHLENLTQEFYA